MHPELIKALIRIGGTTPADIASELGVSRMTVSHVIHGRGISARVAQRISEVIDKPLEELWPGSYQKSNRQRRAMRSLPKEGRAAAVAAKGAK